MDNNTEFVGLRIPSDLLNAFKKLAENNDRSFSAEVRRAMNAHLNSQQGTDKK